MNEIALLFILIGISMLLMVGMFLIVIFLMILVLIVLYLWSFVEDIIDYIVDWWNGR